MRPRALIAKIMTECPIAPKALRPEIPLTLSRLIERASPSTIDELIRKLEPFGTELGFRGQMTVGGSDIPSVRTPGSSAPAARAAGSATTLRIRIRA